MQEPTPVKNHTFGKPLPTRAERREAARFQLASQKRLHLANAARTAAAQRNAAPSAREIFAATQIRRNIMADLQDKIDLDTTQLAVATALLAERAK